VLFVLNDITGDSAQDYVIAMTELEQNQLRDQWQAQMGRPPTEQELAGLTQQWIKEEIYYREAERLGLDADDVIIRRRLVQKLTFLTEDIATATDPTAEELTSHYQANLAQYTDPDRYSFEHRYFSSDRREDAEADARAALASNNIEGDPFMLQRQYSERSLRAIAELFGRDFSDALPELARDQWTGPVQSAYGWHLVKIDAHLPAAARSFESVVNQVANDVKLEKRAEANRVYYEGLKSRYEIIGP
jgi:parvulin-like peptidyl-prolyl isomerase